MKRRNKNQKALLHDFLMIGFGIAIAVFLVKTGLLDFIINLFRDYYILASFISGIFFTSAFTLAPASVSIAHIAQTSPLSGVVFWAALGAMCGDLILFFFIRDKFADDLINSMRPSTVKHLFRSLHFGFLKWISPLIGALIIASPLPDEFGIALLGVSKIRTIVLIPVSFVMNMLGIYILIAFSHLL